MDIIFVSLAYDIVRIGAYRRGNEDAFENRKIANGYVSIGPGHVLKRRSD
jgi:hypothetical protein